jgi:3',5'-cyclic-AMP phosphodiesterase
MPIYLPPLSRRRFLFRSLAAAAGIGLKPYLLAAQKPTDPNAWALLADTHLAANRAQLARGITMAEHFERVSNEVVGLAKRPAGLILTGDCAYNSGETGDYATMAELVQPIRREQIPLHLALGNHDNRDRFWEAFANKQAAKRPIADRQAALITGPRANWLILDSLEKTLSTPGLLGPQQLKWLGETLDAHQRKPALIVIHHNPGLNGNMGLKDTQALFDVIRPRKQVKAYVYGHTHNWKVEQDDSGIHLINLPPTAYVFREGDPSGWVHAQLQKDGMHMELHCLERAHPAHGQVVELKWRT